jgi:hypothetical protein
MTFSRRRGNGYLSRFTDSWLGDGFKKALSRMSRTLAPPARAGVDECHEYKVKSETSDLEEIYGIFRKSISEMLSEKKIRDIRPFVPFVIRLF